MKTDASTQHDDGVMTLIKTKLQENAFEEVKYIIQGGNFTDRARALRLWDAAHYRQLEAQLGKPLTSLQRFRSRKRNKPPRSIYPDGQRPNYCMSTRARSVLREWWMTHSDTYLTRQDKVELATEAGITALQVKNWFSNARRRLRKEARRAADGDCPASSYVQSGINDIDQPSHENTCPRTEKDALKIDKSSTLPLGNDCKYIYNLNNNSIVTMKTELVNPTNCDKIVPVTFIPIKDFDLRHFEPVATALSITAKSTINPVEQSNLVAHTPNSNNSITLRAINDLNSVGYMNSNDQTASTDIVNSTETNTTDHTALDLSEHRTNYTLEPARSTDTVNMIPNQTLTNACYNSPLTVSTPRIGNTEMIKYNILPADSKLTEGSNILLVNNKEDPSQRTVLVGRLYKVNKIFDSNESKKENGPFQTQHQESENHSPSISSCRTMKSPDKCTKMVTANTDSDTKASSNDTLHVKSMLKQKLQMQSNKKVQETDNHILHPVCTNLTDDDVEESNKSINGPNILQEIEKLCLKVDTTTVSPIDYALSVKFNKMGKQNSSQFVYEHNKMIECFPLTTDNVGTKNELTDFLRNHDLQWKARTSKMYSRVPFGRAGRKNSKPYTNYKYDNHDPNSYLTPMPAANNNIRNFNDYPMETSEFERSQSSQRPFHDLHKESRPHFPTDQSGVMDESHWQTSLVSHSQRETTRFPESLTTGEAGVQSSEHTKHDSNIFERRTLMDSVHSQEYCPISIQTNGQLSSFHGNSRNYEMFGCYSNSRMLEMQSREENSGYIGANYAQDGYYGNGGNSSIGYYGNTSLSRNNYNYYGNGGFYMRNSTGGGNDIHTLSGNSDDAWSITGGNYPIQNFGHPPANTSRVTDTVDDAVQGLLNLSSWESQDVTPSINSSNLT